MDEETIQVPLTLENGVTIRVEARPVVAGAPSNSERDVAFVPAGGAGERDVKSIPADFDQVATAIEGIANSFTNAIEKIAPKKTTIEFGLELQVESGGLTALIVKGTGKSSLKVTMEWS